MERLFPQFSEADHANWGQVVTRARAGDVGALSQVSAEQSVELKPMRSQPTDSEVVVRTEIRGKGDPIQLDYRLEKAGDAWKIYDVNVMGVWLVENYRNSFAQEIGANGIDGLIAKLAERNKAAGAKS